MSPGIAGGRPRKGKMPSHIATLLYPEDLELFKIAEKLAKAEGKSLSDLSKMALAEYVRAHCPSNPQLNLYAVSEDLSMSDKISLNFMRRQLREALETSQRLPSAKVELMQGRFEMLLKKGAKVWDRTHDEELKGLLLEAQKVTNHDA